MRLRNFPTVDGRDKQQMLDRLTELWGPVRVESPAGGTIAVHLAFVTLKDLGVMFGSFGTAIDIVQHAKGDSIQLQFPQRGMAELNIGPQTYIAVPGKAVLIDQAQLSRFSIRHPPSFKTIGISFPKRVVEEHLSARLMRPIRGKISFEPEIDLTSSLGTTMAYLSQCLVTGLENDLLRTAPITISNLSEALISLLIEMSPHAKSGLVAPTIAPRNVKRAIDYMHAHIDQPLTIAQIAEASQTSIRSLQMGFQRFRGMSPLVYLRRIRLEAARADLSKPDNSLSVSETARKWGFAHLGRFASEYRNAFGELPSETTARAGR